MRLKIYNAEEKDKTTYLKLQYEGNSVHLVACDSAGVTICGGNLLSINANGIWLCHGVANDRGFPLDSTGRIKVCV